MTDKNIIPGRTAPNLEFDVLNVPEARWALRRAEPARFSLLIFYRGQHCPICKTYLQSFESKMDELRSLGVEPVALSMDDASRAKQSVEDWGIRKLPVGYGLSREDARNWDLYISESIKEGEPRVFSEPGLFLIDRDSTVYYAALNSMPFGRPRPEDVVDAIRYIEEKAYPPRGRFAA